MNANTQMQQPATLSGVRGQDNLLGMLGDDSQPIISASEEQLQPVHDYGAE